MGGGALQKPLIESRPFLLSECLRATPPWWGCAGKGINDTVSRMFYRNNGLLQMLWNHSSIRHASREQSWLSIELSSTKTTAFSNIPHLSPIVVALLPNYVEPIWSPTSARAFWDNLWDSNSLLQIYCLYLPLLSSTCSVWCLWLKGSVD